MKSVGLANRNLGIVTVLVSLVLAMALVMFGCAPAAENYKIDYGSEIDYYDNPPTSANAGEEVTVICIMDVADATLSFEVDGEPAQFSALPQGGYEITFTMPDHDVEVETRLLPPAGAGS